VDQVARVGGCQRVAYLPADLDRVRLRQPSVKGKDLGQVQAVDVLHHEEERTVGRRAEIEHVRDVLVREARSRPSLCRETVARRLFVRVLRPQQLHRDVAVEPQVEREKDLRCATLADLLEDAVAAAERLLVGRPGARGRLICGSGSRHDGPGSFPRHEMHAARRHRTTRCSALTGRALPS
jgi:hypothetical protein